MRPYRLSNCLTRSGVDHRVAEVREIDPVKQHVSVTTNGGSEVIGYDRLVLALGSQLVRPAIPGLMSNGFDVDTYAAAVRLDTHLAALGEQAASEGLATVVIVGAGFTGIEVATEMPGKLEKAGLSGNRRVILVDPNPVVGETIGEQARPIVSEALAALGVETRLNVTVTSVDASSVTLSSGEMIPTRTVVWCAGMRASPVAQTIAVERDRLGRLHVDHFMRVAGATNIFAAGDVASCVVDGEHSTVMSCQFARPMGRFAGNNVVADLLGQPMLPLHDRLVCDRARSRSLGSPSYRRMGPPAVFIRSPREGDQASDQPAADLSAEERCTRGHSGCRRTDGAEAATSCASIIRLRRQRAGRTGRQFTNPAAIR